GHVLDHLGLMPAERGIAEDLVEHLQCKPAQSRRHQARMRRAIAQAIAAMKAEQGMVRIHAHSRSPAMPQRTAETFCAAPTPTMEPVIVCVVETGMPKPVARNSAADPDSSAQNPPTGRILVMRCPMVFTMRQPPKSVPRPMVT